MTKSGHVSVERRGRAAVIWLDRPDALNAFTIAMLADVRTAVADLMIDPNVVGIVISGRGRGICAGFDATGLAELADRGGEVTLPSRPGDPPAVFSYLIACDKPVVAAVNGPAAGVGFVLAVMSDLRNSLSGNVVRGDRPDR